MIDRSQTAIRRPGYLYVAVLFTSLIVSTMGLVALTTASLRTRNAIDSNDRLAAELLASSAIEDAVMQLSSNNGWRATYVVNVESTPVNLGNGSYSWYLKDADGSLNDDDSDTVQVVGIGRVGRAVVAESVRLYPTGDALTSLEVALHCNGDMTLGSSMAMTTNQIVSSNGNIAASAFLTSIQGNVEAVGTISGNVSGTETAGVDARRMPGSSVFDYYLDNGTYIPYSSLPIVNSAATIQRVVLAPTSNPYGSGNSEGIYVIDCGGQRIRIADCRIVGTLVLLNPASNSTLEGSIRWDAAVANYPALLVSGEMEVRTSAADLSETVLLINFNPNGIPYLGIQDADILDVYPPDINGLVYFSGRFNLPQDLVENRFRGTVVCDSIVAHSSCRFNYRSLLYEYPPPGFASGNPMAVSPGSRRRESLP